jgi:signal transduction histidine kinase
MNSDGAEGQKGFWLERALQEFLVCGTLLVDTSKAILVETDGAARALGMGRELPRGTTVDILPEPLKRPILEALSTGKPVCQRLIEIPADGRESTTIGLSCVPVEIEGRFLGIMATLRGLAQEADSPRGLLHLGRLANTGTLSAGLAHEAKNALVVIKTHIDLMLEQNPGAELADLARRELARADEILSRMLNFAAPSRSSLSTVQLHAVLNNALGLVRPQLRTKVITVNCSFEAESDAIQGNDRDLEQAFLNILLNAAEAMGENGALTVRTDQGGAAATGAGQIRVTIADTGVGIPPENLARLFQPFFTTKPGGNGLGLAMARRVILDHQGEITVESRPGEGTTFSIQLPASPAPA